MFKNSLILDYGEFGKNDPTTNEIANLTSQCGQLDIIISISFLLLMIVLLVIGLIRRKTSV
ncbi:MAG: hypothetical protein MI810_14155 [Flavobacteriales bacterium]|nr:hypothetical protein [Flavobacteriales bacterium]